MRETFVADDGFVFVCADYSQIELRIVAHLACDPVLLDSFSKGEDIHARTASEVFGILPGLVTPEMRRRAKAINFGIIYGMGSYGLAGELGIPVAEAQEYIDRYFARYAGVKRFIDDTIAQATERGFTRTMYGRVRTVPELKSPVERIARLGARIAVNTPIQGSAADIIKAAMLRAHEEYRARRLKSRLILQIHDELVVEARLDEINEATELLRSSMEKVASLKVPISVNIRKGATLGLFE